ncbi:endonuclease I [Anoxybacillus vitaminiphilus]|uniref:Endonuclease I n=1 Tax=Paranoxybacillus vitaminiphilus TaxID=581036 RepID=A0A327YFR4_9BACL|nr:endonuclease [Anoxybacillus vitaminiphilus]RAK18946.1 endonuclease I [Anoxybacillus vitaminiphilus]
MHKTAADETVLLKNFQELEQWSSDDVVEQLDTLKEYQEKIRTNKDVYYNERDDKRAMERYYRHVSINESDGLKLFFQYHELVKKTHKRRLPYFFSKDEYLYTWVDLQPDGSVKSIYSGEHKDPEMLIVQDYETIRKRYEQFLQLLRMTRKAKFDVGKKMISIEKQFKFNTEHVVPQSWFGAREPMKGDLHHLFVCQPECNTTRSNFPYADFPFYEPESPAEPIRNHCGVANNEYFEPEYGKGTVARAMMYFLLRYPNEIRKPFRKKIDISLLVQWHQQFPVTIYEKHRNWAIYRIQGNRNPFIDFPTLAERIHFPML